MQFATSARQRTRRGAVTVWVVISLSVLLGVLAIGMDGGRMMDERRRVQSGADAAALAAACDLYDHFSQNKGTDPDGTARAAALRMAAVNGYANDGANSVVTVNIPPQSGQFAAQTDHVEVVVESRVEAGFSRVFAANTLTIRSRSVARGRPKKFGIVLLHPTMSASMKVTGSGSLWVKEASIMVNSSAPDAYDTSGIIRADSHEIVGGIKQTTGVIGTINTGVPHMADPLRKIPVPYLPDFLLRNSGQLVLTNAGPVTLVPGVYRGGILLKGTGSVTLSPGLYLMDGGGLVRKGTSPVSGAGVMIYNTGKSKNSIAGVTDPDGATNLFEAGPVRFEQQATVALTPPTSGPYTGICVFQARHLGNDPHVHFEPGGTVHIEGAIYAVNSHLHLAGKGGPSTDTFAAIICRNLDANPNGALEVIPGTIRPRVPDVRLVD